MDIKLFLAFIAMSAAISSWAGTKQLEVIVMNLGNESFYKSSIFNEYLMILNNDSIRDSCWNKYGDGTGIGLMVAKNIPTGINVELARKIWRGDFHSIESARKIMHKGDSNNISGDGYHGMYIIKPENGQLAIMGIGANANPKKGLTGISPIIKDIKLDQSKPKEGAKIFERSLCHVSKPFNIGFGV